jgi:hypothetical protein
VRLCGCRGLERLYRLSNLGKDSTLCRFHLKWPRSSVGRIIVGWFCDGSVMLEGLEALIESYSGAILYASQ